MRKEGQAVIELCLYVHKDDRWCFALRSRPGDPPCYWSSWYADLEAALVAGRNAARERYPLESASCICVGLWGPNANSWRGPWLDAEEKASG